MKLGKCLIAVVLTIVTVLPLQADEPAKPGGTLVMVSSQVPQHLNPAIQSGIATMMPGAQIFAMLVRADENWKFHPYLAESWDVAPDGLSVTFRLRQNARFHDGMPVTSKDVAFSIATQKKHHPFKTSLGAVSSVETPDPHTVVVKLTTPHPALLLAMSTSILPIIPAHVYGDGQDIKNHPRNAENVVGSGPFRLTEYRPGDSIILEKNPDFFLEGRPYLDRIVIKIIKDQSALVRAMEHGEAHMYPFIATVADIKRLQEAEDLIVTDDGYEGIGPNTWLAFNTKKPPLDDVRVRKAIAYAMDRDFITRALHRGVSTPSTGPIVPGSPFYAENVEKYEIDLDKAIALLDEAGHKPAANGTRLKLTIDYLPSVPDVQQRIAEYARQQLKKIGIDLSVRSSPDFPSWAKLVSNWEFDMSMDLPFNWGDPVIGVHRTFLCDNIVKGVIWSNTQQYCNTEVDKLLLAAGTELDEAKRRDLYVKAQTTIVDEVPIYFVAVLPYHTAYSKKLGNPPTTIWGTVSPLDELYWKEQPN